VTEPGGAAYAPVVDAFGPGVLSADGRIDRKRLGAVVFADPAARQQLNALVHPRIRELETDVVLGWQRSGESVGVVDAALLVETGTHLRFARLVVVHCPPAMQRARLMARDGLDRSAMEARLRAQMPIGDKRWFGNLEVDTQGRLEDTDAQAARLATELRTMAATIDAPKPCAQEVLLGALAHGATYGPGGLVPDRLLAEIADSSGLDLGRLAGGLQPRISGAWYESREALPGPGPCTLAPALAVWTALAGHDAEFAAAAMGSLARLVGAASRDAASAVFLTAAFLDLLRTPGSFPSVAAADLQAWSRLGERWGAARVPQAAIDLVSRFPFLPARPSDARRLAEANGWDADAAAALVSLRAGARAEDAPDAARVLARIAKARAQ
jgi:dephospho-CoA kinase